MILDCQNISKAFGTNVILDNVSFHLEDKEKMAIVGINGAGKTTLLKIIMQEEEADSGQIVLSKDRTIGYLSQHQDIFYDDTVYGVMEDAMKPVIELQDKIRKLEQDMTTLTGDELKAALSTYNRYTHEFEYKNGYAYESEITGVLKGLGFSKEDFERHTDTLSGGQKTRLSLGRLLLTKPDIIILDEPTAFLDVVSRIEIMTLLHQLAVEQNKAILLSTHDIEQALVLSDKLWLLSKETGLQCGVTEDMILNHRMDTLFSHSNIRFDYNHGIYYPTVTGKKEIRVEAENDTLLHWTINALNRHGYTCLPANQGNRFLPYLQALSDHRLILTQKEETHTYSSFEEVLAQLI